MKYTYESLLIAYNSKSTGIRTCCQEERRNANDKIHKKYKGILVKTQAMSCDEVETYVQRYAG